ncbi:MAG: yijE [Gemmataceae bacterium]|nr:yijE [Gemmataceae bacterium]
MSAAAPSVAQARVCLVLAAGLWSLGSLFMRLLREPTAFALNDPPLSPLQIAFYRGLFGGLVLLVWVRRPEVRYRPLMLGMVAAFAVMCALYLSALGLGPAANAIFLQNTAPIWVYLFAVFLLGEPADRRGWQAVLLAGIGAVVIVAGNWPRGLGPDESRSQVLILFMGAGSGVVYAGVMIFLRVLRAESPAWLVTLNLTGSAAALGLFVLVADGPAEFWRWVSAPTPGQLAVLVVFGAVQMALPYWLFARGLRTVSPQEAGIITLLEPLLNPVWAYLVTPEKDTPTGPMVAGGAIILAALAWRYVPQSAPAGDCTPS